MRTSVSPPPPPPFSRGPVSTHVHGWRRRRLALFACLLPLLLPWSESAAHEVSSVSLIAYLDTRERTFLLDAAMEVVPSLDPAVNDEISAEDAARLFAEEYLKVLFDESEQSPALEIHLETASDEETPDELQRQQVLTQLRGGMPEGAREFLLYLHPNCPMAVVLVVVKDGQPSRRMQVVLAGEFSRPVNVEPYSEGDPFASEAAPVPHAQAADAEAAAASAAGGKAVPRVGETADPDDGASGAGFADGFRSGFAAFYTATPLGPALVVALFLLTLRRRPTVWQLASLLVGLSTALAIFGLFPMDGLSGPAGILLAALVAAFGTESFFHRECRWWRPPGVFIAAMCLGALIVADGVAWDPVASDEPRAVSAWLAWAFGVEVAAALLALGAIGALLFMSRFAWFGRRALPILSVGAAAFGVYFLVERFL